MISKSSVKAKQSSGNVWPHKAPTLYTTTWSALVISARRVPYSILLATIKLCFNVCKQGQWTTGLSIQIHNGEVAVDTWEGRQATLASNAQVPTNGNTQLWFAGSSASEPLHWTQVSRALWHLFGLFVSCRTSLVLLHDAGVAPWPLT